MVHPLIGIHVLLGEIGVFAFLWLMIELFSPTEQRVNRAKKAAMLGVIFILLSWLVGGYYYVNVYGPDVKPIIKAGPTPWAHAIFMEAKEHIFLFLPFLTLFALGLIYKYKNELIANNKNIKIPVLILCALIVLIGLSMAGMGYIISGSFRGALEAKLL